MCLSPNLQSDIAAWMLQGGQQRHSMISSVEPWAARLILLAFIDSFIAPCGAPLCGAHTPQVEQKTGKGLSIGISHAKALRDVVSKDEAAIPEKKRAAIVAVSMNFGVETMALIDEVAYMQTGAPQQRGSLHSCRTRLLGIPTRNS